MTCTQVNNDGSVEITWENPDDLSDFKHFVIYRSFNGSSFVPILTPIQDVTTNSFHDITDQANTRQIFYYVEVVSISDETANSEIIGTIYLQVDNNVPAFNKADLIWTAVSDPPPQSTIGVYNIYWDYPGGVWTLINSSNELTYSLDIAVCQETINFKIELENQNCVSSSNIRGGEFKDVEYPNVTTFDSVSVNNNSEAIFGWQISTSTDVAGYIIYEDINNTWVEFDTVEGINNTFYTDIRHNACSENISYAIAAIDSCGNKSEGTFLFPQHSVFLNEIGYNVCAKQDTLVWEQYVNAKNGVEKYLIFKSESGSNFVEIASIPPPAGTFTGEITFIDEDINPGTTYEYYVQAIFETGTSSSCKKIINTFSYKIPQYVYFANADVLPSDEIELTTVVDVDVYSCTWEFHRYDQNNNIDINIGNIDRNQISNSPFRKTDNTADPQNNSYEYYALVSDSCGIQRLESNHLKTILLKGSKVNEQTINLQWNAFEGWETEVEKYYIYRLTGNETSFFLIDSVDSQIFSYNDFPNYEQLNAGKITYWVEAKQKSGGNYNLRSFSNSNRFDIFFESNIFFANAFRPTGLNNEFKPIFNFFSGSEYLFQIFNRWGQLIFETSNSEEGWNGNIDGQQQPIGAYVYRLTYKNIYGFSIEKKGTVMLLN
jgi:gliding motility-associated-like protein